MRGVPSAAAVILCAAIASFLGYRQIAASSPTFDEPVHLAAGYTDLKDGSYRLHATGHPPLAQMWAGVPLLFMTPDRFSDSAEWLDAEPANFGDLFLYRNSVPAGVLLGAARFWNLMTLTLAVAACLVLWAGRSGGAPAAWSAAGALAFCVPWYSNAALVTTDGGSAALFFLACALLASSKRTAATWTAAGLAAGAALAAKFNMVLLLPLAGAALTVESLADRSRRPRPLFLILAGTAAVATLAAAYRIAHLPLYWEEFSRLLGLLAEGRGSYLLGAVSTSGRWWYFPAAMLVKTPLALLLLGAVGLWAASRRPRAEAAWLLIPPAGYFAASLASRTQIGYRHVLPVYPFLCLWAALGASWLWRRGRRGRVLLAAAGLWLAVSAVRAAPHSLSYFNEIVRGRGGEWLSDSNLDWGQDLPALARELASRGNPPVVLSYFGTGDPAAYGIRYVPLATVSVVKRTGDAELARGGPVLLAVSQTNLVGTYYSDPRLFEWLASRRPVAAPGGSIFLYDLTADAPGRAILARMLAASGRADDARTLVLQSGS